MKNIHRQLLEHIQSGERIVLATVVKTAGSTPQKSGSSALFGEKGLISGTIGGGQLEGDVEQIARKALISGSSGLYYFNLNTDAESPGAICGGETEVLVDANPEKHRAALEEMEQSLSKGSKGHICSIISNKPGEDFSIEQKWITGTEPQLPSDEKNECLFIEAIKPFPHLVIAGAGHVGRALAHLASLLDFEITIIDDRREYACMDHIPDADQFIVKDIGLAMSELDLGPDTYIVIVTRGHSSDAEALKACVGSEAAYVGMIGSKHKVTTMKKQFIENGLATEEQWTRIHTPIGISIASVTVQEIAISIAAQLVSERAKNQSGNA